MTIQIEKQLGQHMVTISGRIDAQTAPDIQKKVETLLTEDLPVITFHLGNVNYISSAGLSIFLRLAKQTDMFNERVVLKGLNDMLKSLFKISGIEHFFDFSER